MSVTVDSINLESGAGRGLWDVDAALTDEGWVVATGGLLGQLTLHGGKDWSKLQEHAFDAEITALTFVPGGQEIAVGFEDGAMTTFSVPSLELKDMVTRFAARIRDVSYTPDGELLAVCSEEHPGVRVLRPSRKEKVMVISEHDGGVKCVAWDPKKEYLATIGLDGTLCVWRIPVDLEDLMCECVHQERGILPKDTGSQLQDCRPSRLAWHPKGDSLALPGDDSILLLARDSWTKSYIVADPPEQGHVDKISSCSWTGEGKHLVTTGLDRRVIVWDVEVKLPVRVYCDEDHQICAAKLMVGSSESSMAVTSVVGGFTVLKDVLPKPAAIPAAGPKATTAPLFMPNAGASKGAQGNKSAAAPPKQKLKKNVPSRGGFESEDDAMLAGAEQEAREARKRLIDDEAEDAGDVSDAETVDHQGDHVEGDEGGGPGDSLVEGNVLDDTAQLEYGQALETPLQAAFQPSSTPLVNRRRYLCWNSVGTIISIEEGASNAVEVEFADTAMGRTQRFLDSWNFTLASLGEGGAAFCSQSDQDGGDDDNSGTDRDRNNSRSVLYYKALERRAEGHSWTRMLPRGESAECVAVGRGWVAVASTRHRLHVFSSGGIQTTVLNLPGPPVCMAGSGAFLAVVFHKGAPLDETQHLGFWLLNMEGRQQVAAGAVCLSPGSSLTWMGFSDELLLSIVDSEGMVSGLTPAFGWQWTPLLDLAAGRHGRQDTVWPVALITGKLVAVMLRGTEQHPATLPRPVVSSLELKAPAGTLHPPGADSVALNKFEQQLAPTSARIRQRAFNLQSRVADAYYSQEELEVELDRQQAMLDATALRTFQTACAQGDTARATGLAGLLHLEKSMGIAIKVADHQGLAPLASSIEQLMIDRFHAAQDTQEEAGYGSEAEEESFAPPTRSAPRAPPAKLGPLARAREQQAEGQRRRERTQAAASPQPTDTFVDQYEDQEPHDEPEGVVEDQGMDESDTPTAAPSVTVMDKPAPVNPFARSKILSPVKKRKDVFTSLNEMKASPSPAKKKPALQRATSFAQEARSKKKHDKRVL